MTHTKSLRDEKHAMSRNVRGGYANERSRPCRLRTTVGALLMAGLGTAGWAQQPAPVRPPIGVESGPASWAAGPYRYDGAGNITSIGSPWGTQTFTYDNVGRLVSAHVTSP